MKLTKKATIRKNDSNKCPYGLSVPLACSCVGEAISRMTPLDAVEDEDKKEALKKANGLVFLYHKDGAECPFADAILKKFDAVDCDWGDTAAGQKSVPIAGSPLYVRTMGGVGADGLHSFPAGMYSDNYPARNMFYGLFSFLGSKKVNEIIKLADKYDECGEKEKADRIDELMEKIESIRDEEEFKKVEEEVESLLREYSDKYNDTRKDSGFLRDLSDKYFGPRQYNAPR